MLRLRFSDGQIARGSVVVALLLALFVNVPFLVSNTVFGGDDWAWIWTFHTYGAKAVQHYLAASGHPGYGPVCNLLLALGGQHVGRLAHVFMIAFHLGNGWLIWRIFHDSHHPPSLAASVAVLFLSAPYLAGLHASLAHAPYDFAIFFYLLSIWLSLRIGRLALAGAAIAGIIGLSVETLMALEPLRWWVLYRARGNAFAAARVGALFIVIAFFVALTRMFWFVPSGPYAGYNVIAYAGIGEYLRRAAHYIAFFVDIRQPVAFAGSLAQHENPLFTCAIFIGACIASGSVWCGRLAEDHELRAFFVVAGVTLFLGMSPYVAIGDIPSRVDVSSRFAVASQFGALMLMAGVIQLLPFAAVRAILLTALLFVFMANQFQLGKWLLYEGQVIGDFRRQVGAYIGRTGDQVLVVDFSPPSREFLYLNRACLGSYDTNVSLALTHERGGSFVFDGGCPYRYYGKSEGCFITAFDPPATCPENQRRAVYRLKPDLVPFSRFQFGDLVKRVTAGPLLDAGDLLPDGSVAPEAPTMRDQRAH